MVLASSWDSVVLNSAPAGEPDRETERARRSIRAVEDCSLVQLGRKQLLAARPLEVSGKAVN